MTHDDGDRGYFVDLRGVQGARRRKNEKICKFHFRG